MIPLLGRQAAVALDRDAAERLGLPTLVLMENAGRGAFDAIAARFGARLHKVVIVAGPGQNGGDGLVVARHLLQAGHSPVVLLAGATSALVGDAAHNARVLAALRVPIIEVADDLTPLESAIRNGASLLVDALFGTGLSRPIVGAHAAIIERMNGAGAELPCVALDLPSGIDADTGAVLGVAVRAALTITFAARKRGLYQHPGASHAGEVVLAPIGMPLPAATLASAAGLLEAADVRRYLAPRARDAHKGSAGHVLIVAGSPGHSGAAVLAGLGALRAGAGLATLATDESARAALDGKVTELMIAALPSDHDDALAAVHALAHGKQAAVLGPGFGTGPDALALLRALALELPLPVVLDADALTALGTDYGFLRRAAGPRVLTPHPGEAARLLGGTSDEIQADRFAAAQRLCEGTGATVVLKGSLSIVATPDAPPCVNPTGTPAMAAPGMGDVLAGALGALLATLSPRQAACTGVYLHGLAGQLATRHDRGLLASELSAELPAAVTACLTGPPA